MKLSNRVVEKMRKQPASGGVFPETLKSKGKRQKLKLITFRHLPFSTHYKNSQFLPFAF
jgi:hypothetical protein